MVIVCRINIDSSIHLTFGNTETSDFKINQENSIFAAFYTADILNNQNKFSCGLLSIYTTT